MEANLIVTYEPTHAGKAKEEVEDVLKDKQVTFLESKFDGVFLLHTNDDPKKIVIELTTLCEEEPFRFSKTFRWIPIEHWCNTDIKEMKRLTKQVSENIAPKDTWKMDIGRRGFQADVRELILQLTEEIDKPNVDIKNPQKIVKVEIVGNRAGISLLNLDECLTVSKTKME